MCLHLHVRGRPPGVRLARQPSTTTAGRHGKRRPRAVALSSRCVVAAAPVPGAALGPAGHAALRRRHRRGGRRSRMRRARWPRRRAVPCAGLRRVRHGCSPPLSLCPVLALLSSLCSLFPLSLCPVLALLSSLCTLCALCFVLSPLCALSPLCSLCSLSPLCSLALSLSRPLSPSLALSRPHSLSRPLCALCFSLCSLSPLCALSLSPSLSLSLCARSTLYSPLPSLCSLLSPLCSVLRSELSRPLLPSLCSLTPP